MVPDEALRKLQKDYSPNRAERRRKPITDPKFTGKTARMKSKEENDAVRQRVLRKEKGEQERIAKKRNGEK
jgi:hypothetical protein